MDIDTLTELIATRLEDFAEQYEYLISIGDEKNAELVAQEGCMLANAHDSNDVFIVLYNLEENSV